MAPIRGARRAAAVNQNLPVFSHEYVIQNHADIVFSAAMVIVFSLFFQITTPVSSLFLTLQYERAAVDERNDPQTYGIGLKDSFAVFFCMLVCIMFHAHLQTCVLDKISRKLHLSKTKNSKFNESGQLIVFNAISLTWALDITVNENLIADLLSLWERHPNSTLSFSTKLFYIIQFAYWAHILPELYFQKVKKGERFNRVKYSVLYLAFISTVYNYKFHHIGVVVLLFHYITGFIKHTVKLIDIIEKNEDRKNVQLAQNVYQFLFFVLHLLILIISQTALWFSVVFINPMFKLFCSISALAIQAWIVYEFFSEFYTFSESFNISALMGLFKSKLKLAKNDNASKKSQNTSKFNGLSEIDQNIKKVQKSEIKKGAKIAKNAAKIVATSK